MMYTGAAKRASRTKENRNGFAYVFPIISATVITETDAVAL